MGAKDLIGKGLNFPIYLENGGVRLSSYEVLIENSVRTILSWTLTTRPFNPGFGCRLWELIGHPNDLVLEALAKRFIVDALSNWEKRISLLETTISCPEATQMLINIKYKIRSTEQVKELEYIYYT